MLLKGKRIFLTEDNLTNRSVIQHIPIVVVSAKDPSIAIPEVQAKGFSGFIAKSINRLRFAQQIAWAIEGKPVCWAAD